MWGDELPRAEEAVQARYGITPRSRFVDVPAIGGRARVLTLGEGPPMVLVPGLTDPAGIFAPLLGEIRGFALHVVERPGAGLTDFARLRPGALRSLAVRFLSEVLDGLGLERPAFLANSMGSLWTFWLALDRPERVRFMVHAGCPAFILGTSAPLPLRMLGVPGLGRLAMRLTPPSPASVERLAAMAGEDLTALPEVRDLLVASQRLPRAEDALLELLRASLRLGRPRPEVRLGEDSLARVTQPVLLLWGERDPFGSPRVGERAAELVPDAELVVLPTGHLPWLSRPREVAARAMEFGERHL